MAVMFERKSLMKTRPQHQFMEKLQTAMADEGLDALVLTSPEAVFYATGYIPWNFVGRACGNIIAIVPSGGRASLIVGQFEQGGAELQTKGEVDIIPYAMSIFIEDYYDPSETDKPPQTDVNKLFDTAYELIASHQKNAKIGMERGCMPYDKFKFWLEKVGADNIVDISSMMVNVKKIKLPWEIEALRYSAQVSEQMMNITMQATHPGMTEADLFKVWYTAAYEVTGGYELIDVNQVHTTGTGFWSTRMPREVPFENGQVNRLDGGVTIYGYWSDLGRSYAVGDRVTPEQQAIFDTLLEGYDLLVEKIKPGVCVSELFTAAMECCRKKALPNFVRGHFGHSLSNGPSPDLPQIAQHSDVVLEPGMVFCIEAPYYSSKHGSFNIEDTLVVTQTGNELFTHTNRTLFVK